MTLKKLVSILFSNLNWNIIDFVWQPILKIDKNQLEFTMGLANELLIKLDLRDPPEQETKQSPEVMLVGYI